MHYFTQPRNLAFCRFNAPCLPPNSISLDSLTLVFSDRGPINLQEMYFDWGGGGRNHGFLFEVWIKRHERNRFFIPVWLFLCCQPSTIPYKPQQPSLCNPVSPSTTLYNRVMEQMGQFDGQMNGKKPVADPSVSAAWVPVAPHVPVPIPSNLPAATVPCPCRGPATQPPYPERPQMCDLVLVPVTLP